MANVSGYWAIKYVSTDSDSDEDIELSDSDLEYIANLIKEGYISGEVTKDEN